MADYGCLFGGHRCKSLSEIADGKFDPTFEHACPIASRGDVGGRRCGSSMKAQILLKRSSRSRQDVGDATVLTRAFTRCVFCAVRSQSGTEGESKSDRPGSVAGATLRRFKMLPSFSSSVDPAEFGPLLQEQSSAGGRQFHVKQTNGRVHDHQGKRSPIVEYHRY